jgi:hypothetical protein
MAVIVCGRCENRHVIETVGAPVMLAALVAAGASGPVPTRVLLAQSAARRGSRVARRAVAALPAPQPDLDVFEQIVLHEQEVQ